MASISHLKFICVGVEIKKRVVSIPVAVFIYAYVACDTWKYTNIMSLMALRLERLNNLIMISLFGSC